MAVTYGFFNSNNGDRKYTAAQMSSLFDGLITDGVYLSIGDALEVSQLPTPALSVRVGTGRAWFNHTWTVNDSILTLNLQTADIVYPRIDTVVVEVNSADSVRANSIKVIKGTPAETPVGPTMTHTDTLNQYPLADVYVDANATTILDEDITIRIGSEDCPFVSGVLSSFDVDSLMNEWRSYFSNTFLVNLATYFNGTFIPDRDGEFDALVAAWNINFNLLVSQKGTEFDNLVLDWTEDFEGLISDLQDEFDDWLSTRLYRDVLTETRTYYVRKDGSNSNTGLEDTSGGAWLTVQYAVDFVTRNLDLRHYNVTILVTAVDETTKYDPVVLAPYVTSGGVVTIKGGPIGGSVKPMITPNTGGPGDSSTINAISGTDAGTWVLEDLKVGEGANAILSAGRTRIYVRNLRYYSASTSNAHLRASEGGVIYVQSVQKIHVSGSYHLLAEKGGQIIYQNGSSIVFGGPPEDPPVQGYVTFAYAQLGGLITIPGTTISLTGITVTGRRYSAIGNATIYTNSGGANFFPGTVAGQESYGGIYF